MQSVHQDFVPNFQLYGEVRQSGLPDLIHIETLKDRSQHHDWQIKPHRHADLCQIMSFQSAQVAIDLDGQSTTTNRPSILFVPPRVVHGFRFSPQVIGTVTTIPIELMRADTIGVGHQGQPMLIPAGSTAFDRLKDLLAQIDEEYRRTRPHRQRALQAMVELCMIWISRAQSASAATAKPAGIQPSSDKRINAFLNLVEENFGRGWSATEYARRIGTSKSQLTRDCRALTGRSPMQVVHDRLINEANRKLAYTPWPISQISDALGFSDLGYFSRFYRERAGETPSQYRNRIRQRGTSQ
ncbi:MAG: helix-turn-helix domain-containing protein [Pseudomonadota bacterium]